MTSGGNKYWDIGTLPLIAPDTLGDIIGTLADLAVVVTETGYVLSVLANPVHGAYANLDFWEKADLREFMTVESLPKFEEALADCVKSGQSLRPMEINHKDVNGKSEFPVVYTMHRIGDEALLMLGRDLRPISELQQQLVNAQIAIERDFERQREFDTRFRVLMQSTHDAIVFVSVGSGEVTDANPVAAGLLGQSDDELRAADFAQIFEDQGRSELMADMAASALSEGANPITLVVRGSRRALRVTPSFFRAAGSRMMMCRLETETDAIAKGDLLTQGLDGMFEHGPEAIVFTDAEGLIIASNESFLSLTDTAHGMSIKGRSFAEFLSRGLVDLKVLRDNAVRSGKMRVYSTKILGQYRSQNPIEVSATHLTDSNQPAFVFVIRDSAVGSTNRALNDPDVPREGTKSVGDLVGRATLKEIVADTTDVIEKMCIETAVELTSNNRVAAAEMLGLSRQSLYVKLRKYGLLSKRDTD
ncbi:MAG: transcriptional regulator PpsR [Sedimentitalea sp.]